MVVNPSNLNIPQPDEEMRRLLEKNLELSEKMYKMTKYIRRYVIWSQIFDTLKILLIVAPIILGIMYLPALFRQYKPFLDQAFQAYQGLMSAKDQLGNLGGQIDPGKIDPGKIDASKLPPELQTQIQKYLKK
jgi:hypothetical protein